MQKQAFDNIILIGRGGCGKSELIDFLKRVPEADRLEKFHIGTFEELDDFPWLHSMLKDEDLWEQLGYPRRLGQRKENVYVTRDYNIYGFLILKLNRTVREKFLSSSDFYKNKTLFIEFARGREGAYKKAFGMFDREILKESAVFYLDNTFEESLRRNEVRSNDKDTNQTILNHKVPVEVMEYLYKTHDWHELTDKKPDGYIETQGVRVPFVTVWNIPESHDFSVLEGRYSAPLVKLWELYQNRNSRT